jgi:DNA (cytosine-5)-methyltransferase 1
MTKTLIQPLPATFGQIAAAVAGKKIPDEFSVVSLFSGCGGLDMGFLGGFQFLGKVYDRLPYRIVWANDIKPSACKTYKANLKHEINCDDIWEVLSTLPKSADVVIGGFPCQDVSINGILKGADGVRTNLYKAMVEAVRRTQPRVFVAENVKGLLMPVNKDFYDEIIGAFKDLGYDVPAPQVYLAADYGVPQMRERVFIVGTRGRTKKFVPPMGTVTPAAWITAKAAVDDLKDLPENKAINHIWSRAAKSSEQGDRVLKADRPADTMRAECHGNIQFHYELPRRISMREAARFQSFPDNFHFSGGLRETERQVGNAVPPVLAWHIAKAVRDCLI